MCWFAAKTKRRAEFKAQEFFISTGVNSYVPSFKTKRIWSDRVKNVIVPAISGYVFFELDRMNFNTLNINPFTKNIVRDNSGKPAIIKDSEIKITTIARGVSVGNELEFTDEVTLGRSIIKRIPFENSIKNIS